MQRILAGAMMLVLGVTACSSDTTGAGNPDTAQLSIVNALPAGSTAQLRLDAATVTLPASGTTGRLSVTSGAHQLQVQSSAGKDFGSVSFSVDKDSTRTVVVSGGVDTAVVAVAIDSNLSSPGVGQPVPLTGHILLVNSAPGVGPFDVYVYRANSDSTLHFGSFSFGAGTAASSSPYRFNFPFDPGTYTFDVTNPGSTTALASAVVNLATGDNWMVMLTTSVEGELVLQASKQ